MSASPRPAPTNAASRLRKRLTREQFEKLVKALQQPDKPPMPPDVVRNFASQYAKMLIFADAARDLGLENDPRYVQIFQFVSNQILTDALNQHIVQEYSHISDQTDRRLLQAESQEVRGTTITAHTGLAEPPQARISPSP